jgi:hypothetical protein
MVSTEEVKEIMRKVKTDKTTGWSCIPRTLENPKDDELVNATALILENIINTGIFPDVLNSTRLAVLNKVPSQMAQLKTLRPIQIADIVKVYFESLAQTELSNFSNNDLITGEEQYGFK